MPMRCIYSWIRQYIDDKFFKYVGAHVRQLANEDSRVGAEKDLHTPYVFVYCGYTVSNADITHRCLQLANHWLSDFKPRHKLVNGTICCRVQVYKVEHAKTNKA